MKKFLFLLIIILISINVHAAQNANELFKIEALPLKSTYILGEPILIYGKITYLGNKPLKLPAFRTITMGIKEPCDRPPQEITVYDFPAEWWTHSELIRPGWTYAREECLNQCIGKPRIAKVAYAMSFHPPEGKVIPKDIWQGDIVSEWKQIEIVKPEGIDAEAIYSILGPNLTWQKLSEWPDKYFIDILKKYPSSIYATWIIAKHFTKMEEWPPQKMIELIKNKLFPIGPSIIDPDSPNGWKSVRRLELAEWQIKWSEYIIENHPDFPFARRLKLLIGVDSIIIGQKEKGLLLLNEVSKDANTKEGNWAAEFIALYRNK